MFCMGTERNDVSNFTLEVLPHQERRVLTLELRNEIFQLANSRKEFPLDQFLKVPREFFVEGARGDMYHNWIQKGSKCEVIPGFVNDNFERCGKRGGVVIEFDDYRKDLEARIACSEECYRKLHEGLDYLFEKEGWTLTNLGINGFGRVGMSDHLPTSTENQTKLE